MAYEVQGGQWLVQELQHQAAAPTLAHALLQQTLEHAVPGPYARGVFPSLVGAVQVRPAVAVLDNVMPERPRRPLSRYPSAWVHADDTQRITPRLDMDFGAGWVEVLDVVSPIKAQWGITGAGPADRVAQPGTLTFDLDDNATNEGALRGYYSPDNPAKRAGWGLGTPVRLVLEHEIGDVTETVKWVGRIEHISPRVGVASPTVAVSCADWLEEAALAPLSGLQVLADIQSDFLFAALVAAVATPPPGGTLVKIPGSDIYPYALDQARDESGRVLTELQKLAQSEYGVIYVDAGVAVFEGRCWRGVRRAPEYDLSDDEQVLALPLSAHGREMALNRVQVTVHPRNADAAADAELFRLAAALKVPSGATVTISCPYRDPLQRAQRVSGIDLRTPAPGDYTFRANADGTGANLTPHLEVTAVFGGNSATVTMRNAGGSDGYLPPGGLVLVGRGLYDYAPVISDQRADDSVSLYGENRLAYDAPAQSSPAIADDLSRFFLHLYRDPKTRALSVQFLANWDEATLAAALSLTISDRVAITAASAGLDAVEFFVNSISLEVHQSGLTLVTLTLCECDRDGYWQLGVEGASELGETTRLGYGVFKPGWWLGVEGYSELGVTTRLKGD